MVGVDLITQLPKTANGHTAIITFTDLYGKQVHAIATMDEVTADGVADIYYSQIFRLHGLPASFVSDRGPQFAAKVMQALLKHLGISSNLTTAYHPQGNGKVERKNQEIEQFLRLFISQRQDDWVDWLPMAEFVLNSRVHSGADRAPFEIVYGYVPDFTVPAGKHSAIPALNDRLDRMAQVRREAEAALRLTKVKMKEHYEHQKKAAHVFNIGDLVSLSAKNIAIHQATPKLGPRQLGPF